MLRQTKKHFKYDREFAQEYSQHTNFREVYDFFINSFVEIHGEPSGNLIDLCCGTADITREFKLRFPYLDVHGCDESYDMLNSANHTNIALMNKPINLVSGTFDNIISNNAYHHFDNTADFWNVVNRIAHSKSKILISDVVRPDTLEDVKQIVEDVLGKDSVFAPCFELSLTAGYTEQELQTHVGLLNLIIIDTPFKNYKLFFIHN